MHELPCEYFLVGNNRNYGMQTHSNNILYDPSRESSKSSFHKMRETKRRERRLKRADVFCVKCAQRGTDAQEYEGIEDFDDYRIHIFCID